jgi:DNA-binding transcriptional regulator YiaG
MTPKQIVRIRKAFGWTQQQLADRLGAQQSTIARWEIGQNEPRGANLKALKELAEKLTKTRSKLRGGKTK